MSTLSEGAALGVLPTCHTTRYACVSSPVRQCDTSLGCGVLFHGQALEELIGLLGWPREMESIGKVDCGPAVVIR